MNELVTHLLEHIGILGTLNTEQNMKKYSIIVVALLVSTALFAQAQDSLLRRQMELEREFNPTLRDANKINALPSIPQPIVKKANTAYSTWAGRTTPALEIALPKPGEIMTNIPFSTKRGYITLGAGNYGNMDGALGYRILDTKRDNLSFMFLHNSTNGNIKYVQNAEPSSNKAFYMDNFGQLKYNRIFDTFAINLHASYLHSMFNYYGNTFVTARVVDNKNQTLSVFNAKMGAESQNADWMNYRGYIDFKNFSSKFGNTLSEKGIAGNQVDAGFGVAVPFQGGGSKVGVDGKFLGVFYNSTTINPDNFMLVNASPYLSFEGASWKTRLGADVLFQFADKNKVRVVPNVHLQWMPTEKSSLYANIGGGIDDNTYLNMMNESRYIHPTTLVTPSFSVIDIEAGAKIGEVSGFRFDIFGGFKQTQDEHFLILSTFKDIMPSPTPKPLLVSEFLQPQYANLSHSHIGGMIQSNIWAPLDIAVRVKKNFFTVKDTDIIEAKAYNKPGLEADIRATFEAMSNLKFTLNYYFAGDRWTYFNAANVKMDNINDLNLGAVYDINSSFAINVKANNLLFQKQDIWYGHPAQGFNAMGGFTFKF